MLKKILKFFIILSLFIIHYSLFIGCCFAADEFETSYQIDYVILPDGLCQSKQTVFLTNKLANVYATEYKVTIGSTKLKSIKASDANGKIDPQVKIEENTTVIALQFNQKVIGKDQTLVFNLEYVTPDFSVLNGNVLEIGIPKLAEIEKLKNYRVRLLIPYFYGKSAYFIPYPLKRYQEGNFQIFQFEKDQLVDQGISAAFGESQVLDFQLHYYLKNSSLMPARFQVALPPDTAHQTVYYNYLYPSPLNIQVDEDGNWLAVYQLESKETIDINASGSAVIVMEPREQFKKELINKEEYLKNQKYWETENEKIIQLAKELQTPKNIYDFIVNNLIYDYGRIEGKVKRFGALKTLDNKENAICMEFTDLFVALCRAAGIPAREINGYAYTNNPILRPLSLSQDVLHAWPEYYDSKKNLWVPVDPTWQNTTGGIDFFHKLDFYHFAFVVHGLSSDYPLSVGSYKESENNQQKDVYIQFGKKAEKKENIDLKIDFPKKLLAGLPLQGTIFVKNKGNTALYNQSLIFINPLNKEESKETISVFPPFDSIDKKINFGKTKWYEEKTIDLVFRVNDQKIIEQIQIYPFWKFSFLTLIIKIIVGFIYFGFILVLTKLIKKIP